MTCPECEARRRHVTESTELLRDKEHKYRSQPAFMLPRLLGRYRHQLWQALENLACHEADCVGREP